MYILEQSRKNNNQSQYVDIPLLYDNIIKQVVKHSHLKIKKEEDKDHICMDFIFLINFYGNDFMHQIPTMEISTTILDLIYIYSRFIRENEYIMAIKKNKVFINFNNMKKFFDELTGFEEYLMLDSYTADLQMRSRIYKYFGDIFPFRYLLDYRDKLYEHKEYIYNTIKKGGQSYNSIKQMVSNMISQLNEIQTKSGQRYGDIFIKTEGKNIGSYVSKVMTDPENILDTSNIFIYNIKTRRNRNEKHMTKMINTIEKDLIKHNRSIDMEEVKNSMRDFSFDYENIRDIVPHNQMPTTSKDMDIFLLEWKSGKWMDIVNSYSYELGYDWKKGKIKKIKPEMNRYQHNMLNVNKKQLNYMVVDYLKTLSWMVDYYMNTDDKSTQKYISTWSYRHERSPFISHINYFLQNTTKKNMMSIMIDVYKKSLVSTNKYLTEDIHKLYIYPLTTEKILSLPKKYHSSFPDMAEYIRLTINSAEKKTKNNKRKRFFDCRMCAYLSKCIFENTMLSYKELINININKKKLKRPRII
jgi:5'-3' exonuclease